MTTSERAYLHTERVKPRRDQSLSGDVLRSMSTIPILVEALGGKKPIEHTKHRTHKDKDLLLKNTRLSRAQLEAFEFEYSAQNSWYSLTNKHCIKSENSLQRL